MKALGYGIFVKSFLRAILLIFVVTLSTFIFGLLFAKFGFYHPYLYNFSILIMTVLIGLAVFLITF